MSNVGFSIDEAGKTVAEQEEEGRWVHMKDEAGDLMYFQIDKEGNVVKYVEKDGEFVPATEPVKELPVEFLVVGTYSPTYRKHKRQQKDKLVRMKRNQVSGQLVEEHESADAAAAVKDWRGVFNKPQNQGGELLAFRREYIIKIVDRAPWIQEQIDEEAKDHEAFSRSASAN